VLAVRGQNSSGGFLIFELVIPGRITISPMEGECWQSAETIPLISTLGEIKNPFSGNYPKVVTPWRNYEGRQDGAYFLVIQWLVEWRRWAQLASQV
jgi:hypothetical protein